MNSAIKNLLLLSLSFLVSFILLSSKAEAQVTSVTFVDEMNNPKAVFNCDERVYVRVRASTASHLRFVNFRWSNRIQTGPTNWYPSATGMVRLHQMTTNFPPGPPVCSGSNCFDCQLINSSGTAAEAICGPYPDWKGLPSQSCSDGDPGDTRCCNAYAGAGSGNIWYNGSYYVDISDGVTAPLRTTLNWSCKQPKVTSGPSFDTSCSGSNPVVEVFWSVNTVPAPPSGSLALTLKRCQGATCTTLFTDTTPSSSDSYIDTLTPASVGQTYRYEVEYRRSCDGDGQLRTANITIPSCLGGCAAEFLISCSTAGEYRCSGGSNNGNVQQCSGSPLCWRTTTTCPSCQICDDSTAIPTCYTPTCADLGLDEYYKTEQCTSGIDGDERCENNTCNESRVRKRCDQQGTGSCPYCWEEADCSSTYEWCRISDGVCRQDTSTVCGDGQCIGQERNEATFCPADCGSCVFGCADFGLLPCAVGSPDICMNADSPARCTPIGPYHCYVAQPKCSDSQECHHCENGSCVQDSCAYTKYNLDSSFTEYECDLPNGTGIDSNATGDDCQPGDPGQIAECDHGDERCAYPGNLMCPPLGERETCTRFGGGPEAECKNCWQKISNCPAGEFCTSDSGACTPNISRTLGGCGNSTLANSGDCLPAAAGTGQCGNGEDINNCPCDCDVSGLQCYVPTCANTYGKTSCSTEGEYQCASSDTREQCIRQSLYGLLCWDNLTTCPVGEICEAATGNCVSATSPASCTIDWYCNGSPGCTTSTDALPVELRYTWNDAVLSPAPHLTCSLNATAPTSAYRNQDLTTTDGSEIETFDFNVPPISYSPSYYTCNIAAIGTDTITRNCTTPRFYLVECGDGTCDAAAGENLTTCPDDCGCKGPFSFSWTDPTITADTTIVKSVHFQEIKTGIDMLRADAGLPPVTWATCGTWGVGEPISYQFIECARTYLQEVYVACNAIEATKATPRGDKYLTDTMGTPSVLGSWEDPAISTSTPIRKPHLDQLRLGIEEAY